MKSRHKLFVGASGTGKSTLVKMKLVEDCAKDSDRLIILDCDDDYLPGEHVEHRANDIQNLEEYLKGLQPGEGFSASLVPDLDDEERCCSLLAHYAWAMQGEHGSLAGGALLTYVVEEAHSAMNKAPRRILHCLKRGRKRGIGVWAVSQSLVDVDAKARREMKSQEWWVFRLSTEDFDTVAKAKDSEIASRVLDLPDMHVLRFSPATPGATEFRIVDFNRLEEVRK